MRKQFRDKKDLNLELSKISAILRAAEPYVEGYFKNYICYKTGVKKLETIKNLPKTESIEFLTRLFTVCISELTGGTRINEFGINGFYAFFMDFEGDIHDLKDFQKGLELKWGKKNSYSSIDSPAEVVSSLLDNFKGMGLKTASLFMRFLCQYSEFFYENPKDLPVPLDRVNATMIYHLINSDVLINYPNLFSTLKSGKNKFSTEDIQEFQKLAEEIMGSSEERILIDNLWFIGHFYHYSKLKDCSLRNAILILDRPYTIPYFNIGKAIQLPKKCLFKTIGCGF